MSGGCRLKISLKTAGLYTLLFLIGAVLYPVLEIVWRGYSHITMAFAGGICLCGIWYIDDRLADSGIVLRALLCSGLITAVEFIFGCVFNLALGMNVWDYSDRFLNLFGQICIGYSVLWFFLSIAVLRVCRYIKNRSGAAEPGD